MRRRLAEEWIVFLLAVQFLTRLPVGRDPGWSAERMEATPRWYPAVGILVGGISGAVFWSASAALPQELAVLLALAAGILTTGAFHEDGFADCCDGLGGAVDRARALEIMKDSRLGTYGALGLGLLIAVKAMALSALPGPAVPAVLVAGHALGRASSVVVIATSRYLRDHGTGKPVATGGRGLPLALATGLLALLPAAAILPAGTVLAGAAGLFTGHVAMRRVFERRLGGYTGDCPGAVVQTSETGLYLGLLAGLALVT